MIRKRNKDIDILKGIGIISVVIGHALNTEIFKSDFSEATRKFIYIIWEFFSFVQVICLKLVQ